VSWIKEMWVVGLALFSMFFGAGNVIFPPYLGYSSGSQWPLSFFCYFMADIGLAIVALAAMLRSGSDIDGIARRIGKWPAKIISLLIILCVGPLIAIPRTAATTYELSVLPFTGNLGVGVFSVIFMGTVLLLTIRESSVVDIVGKILTPLLFISLVIIGVVGFITPLGPIPPEAKTATVVSDGILAGYQTMDVLGALIFGVLVIKTINVKGYTSESHKFKIVGGGSLISGAGLFLVYCGLTHLGATTSELFPANITRVKLITSSVKLLLGDYGIMLLAVMVALACLTTAIGITGAAGTYISGLTKKRISYQKVVVCICILSAFLSTMGVEAIVKYAALILNVIYAPILVLIFLNLFGDKISNDNVFKGGALGAFVVSFLAMEIINNKEVLNLIKTFPFSCYDLGWIMPALVGCILGGFIKTGKDDPED
jgi:LIVCS family branched-chain amino acid:cation transporter